MKVLIFSLLLIGTAFACDEKRDTVKVVSIEETSDCKAKSTWEPVYNENGRIVGYIVHSPCEG